MKPMSDTPYSTEFFGARSAETFSSARVVVPLVVDLIKPKSVVDFGCGQGAWLRVFREQGVPTLQGYDGSYVDRNKLLVDQSEFTDANLEAAMTVDRNYDLAVSLEVAEHLRTKRSRNFVRLLASAAPVVLFSAAIPGQGGTSHINEQWPEFWQELFAEFGYRRFDLFRAQIWRNPQVEWWYRQNLYLFAHEKAPNYQAIVDANETENGSSIATELEILSDHTLGRMKSLRGVLSLVIPALNRAIKNKFID